MGGQTGIPVWIHSIIVFCVGAVLVWNPFGWWSITTSANANGGGSDALLWILVILSGPFIVFYGIPLFDAIKKGDGFYGHAIIVTGAFLFVLFMILSIGLVSFDDSSHWATAGMAWFSIIVGLGKYEAAGAEG